MAMKLYPESAVQDIADAIREKSGSSDTYKVSEMANAIENIPSGGGITSDEWATGTISGDINVGTSDVRVRTFQGAPITSVTGTGTGTVYGYAFSGCTSLRTVSLGFTTVNTYVFNGCTALTSVNLPNATSLGEGSFKNCRALVTFNAPNVKSVGQDAFYGCSSLTSIDLTKVNTSLGAQGIFQNCTALTDLYAPHATKFATSGSSTASGCTALISARFPRVSSNTVRSSTFTNDTNLKLVDLGKSQTIASAGNIFTGCSALEVLILRNTSVCTISRRTDFASVTSPVTVYVPSSLKASYEANTNWAAYVAAEKVTFANLEGSPYEAVDFVYNGIPATS